MFLLRLFKLSINLNEPSVFFFKNSGQIISPSSWSHLVIMFFCRGFSISSSMTYWCCWEQRWRWVCTCSSVSSIGRPETVCNVSGYEVKCFQLHGYCLCLPAWNSTLRFVSYVLSIHTLSCGISYLWNDMASGWYCFCCCCCCYRCCCCRKAFSSFLTIVQKRFCLVSNLSLPVPFEIFFVVFFGQFLWTTNILSCLF